MVVGKYTHPSTTSNEDYKILTKEWKNTLSDIIDSENLSNIKKNKSNNLNKCQVSFLVRPNKNRGSLDDKTDFIYDSDGSIKTNKHGYKIREGCNVGSYQLLFNIQGFFYKEGFSLGSRYDEDQELVKVHIGSQISKEIINTYPITKKINDFADKYLNTHSDNYSHYDFIKETLIYSNNIISDIKKNIDDFE